MGAWQPRPAIGMAALPQASTPLCELCAATATASHLGNGATGKLEPMGCRLQHTQYHWHSTLVVIASGTTARHLRRTQTHSRISSSALGYSF